ncbi:MAG: SufE family protein [Phycisphaerales bacterium]
MSLTLPTIQEIEDGFEAMDDWEDRFAYLIDLGRRRPDFPAEAKIDANRVHGCQSTVHLQVDLPDGEHLQVRAESDASMVNGLIAVVIAMYDGKSKAEARAVEPRAVVGRLGLDQHLSQGRRNGLEALIDKIETLTRHG